MKLVKMYDSMRKLIQGKIGRLVLLPGLLIVGPVYAYLTDSAIHAPPTSGTFAYNTFRPGVTGFPAVGATYIDPVFGSAVRRLTARSGAAEDDLYAHHWANANGTYAFQNAGGAKVINVTTGAVLWSGSQVPLGSVGFDIAWDAVNPDWYYYYNGANLVRRSLSAQTNTVIKTFPSTLQANGGSLNTQSADGRYFTVRYSGTNKVWDSQTDTIYSGAITPLASAGWVTITPDGNYLVTAAGSSALPQKQHYSYPINHTTRTVGSTPTQFWGLCGDHGVVMSASDGKSYYVSFACTASNPGVYRVDITLNQTGRTEAQQQGSNVRLLPLNWDDNDGHLSAVSKGAFRDWVFFSSEDQSDTYNSGVSGWRAYKQEIVAMNVITLEVRRLAHHRSRGLSDGSYWNQPRISSSWDGSVVLWNSNFNVNSPSGFAELMSIKDPLGPPSPTTLPAPTNLRVQ